MSASHDLTVAAAVPTASNETTEPADGLHEQADDSALLLQAVNGSGNVAYAMSFHQGFPVRILAGKCPFGEAGDTVVMGDAIHPDDYQPFCEVISRVIAGTADEIKVHARMNCGADYQWFYITGKVCRSTERVDFINGMMFNVTEYLDCDGEDSVMSRFRSKHSVHLNQVNYTLKDILGEDYLVRIQQPFSRIDGLYSAIIDNNGVVILPKGQDKKINLNKMDYQRRKSIRVQHQAVGSWIITGDSQKIVDENASLLETMSQTVSGVANSYVALVDEMETSQKANKLLGENFEDQIFVNGVYSIFLQSPNTKAAIKNITMLITDHFSLAEIQFCGDENNPAKSYRLDRTGAVIPTVGGFKLNAELSAEMDYSGIVCTDLKTVGISTEKSNSCVLARACDRGGNRGIMLYISKKSSVVWSARERTLMKNLTQLLSTVIYRLFLEEELSTSHMRLERLAYYDAPTNIPNRSCFEREFAEGVARRNFGAIIAVEFSNLKNISEIYGFEYADDILRSCAEYITAMPCGVAKRVFRFSNDILFVALRGVDREEARQFAQAILTKFRSPWYLHNNEHRIQTYAGFMMYPTDAESVQGCFNAATHTLRLAKERRLDDAVCYAEGLEDDLNDNRMVKKLITDAAENNFKGFYCLYQPVLEMHTGVLHCCEATLFWGNGDMTIPRERFMPIIDRLDLSRRFYEFTCDMICGFCAEVRSKGFPDFRVSFAIPENIAGTETSVEMIRASLQKYSLPPSAVSVSVPVADSALIAGAYMRRLSDMGVNIIANDTGEGYFTAEPLGNSVVKIVKIKASRLSGDAVSAAFVRSVIKLAKEKHIEVCARDVDNPQDLTALGGFDIDFIEGIFNGRPLRDKDFIDKMIENKQI